jgi:hypothetical protein
MAGSPWKVPRELGPLCARHWAQVAQVDRPLWAAQPISQPRLPGQQDAGNRHDEDGDNGNRPHRLVPARPNRDDYGQHNSAENQPVNDAVQREHVPHRSRLRPGGCPTYRARGWLLHWATCRGVVASIRPRGDCWSGTREHLPTTPVVLLLSEKMQHRSNGHIVGVSRARRVTVSEPRFHSATSISPRPTSVPLCAVSREVVSLVGPRVAIRLARAESQDGWRRRGEPCIAARAVRASRRVPGMDASASRVQRARSEADGRLSSTRRSDRSMVPDARSLDSGQNERSATHLCEYRGERCPSAQRRTQ